MQSLAGSSTPLQARPVLAQRLPSRSVHISRRSLRVRAEGEQDDTLLNRGREKLNEGLEQSKNISGPNVNRGDTQQIEAGNISNENAERRADIGASRPPSFAEAQAFDGPVPETLNSRLAMLGISSALAAEFATGVGLKEQWAIAPTPILLSFAVIAIATYVPVFRGFTRKEPFENGIFTAKAENWNGRAAMIGWTILIVQEALTGKSIPAFWGFN